MPTNPTARKRPPRTRPASAVASLRRAVPRNAHPVIAQTATAASGAQYAVARPQSASPMRQGAVHGLHAWGSGRSAPQEEGSANGAARQDAAHNEYGRTANSRPSSNRHRRASTKPLVRSRSATRRRARPATASASRERRQAMYVEQMRRHKGGPPMLPSGAHGAAEVRRARQRRLRARSNLLAEVHAVADRLSASVSPATVAPKARTAHPITTTDLAATAPGFGLEASVIEQDALHTAPRSVQRLKRRTRSRPSTATVQRVSAPARPGAAVLSTPMRRPWSALDAPPGAMQLPRTQPRSMSPQRAVLGDQLLAHARSLSPSTPDDNGSSPERSRSHTRQGSRSRSPLASKAPRMARATTRSWSATARAQSATGRVARPRTAGSRQRGRGPSVALAARRASVQPSGVAAGSAPRMGVDGADALDSDGDSYVREDLSDYSGESDLEDANLSRLPPHMGAAVSGPREDGGGMQSRALRRRPQSAAATAVGRRSAATARSSIATANQKASRRPHSVMGSHHRSPSRADSTEARVQRVPLSYLFQPHSLIPRRHIDYR